MSSFTPSTNTGASHTTRLFEQIPYLTSGGMLGIAFACIGAALYFGYWLTRLVGHAREIVDGLARIEARLDGAGGTAAVERDVQLVATKGGELFHRADCSVVAGRPQSELRSVSLPARGLAPCKLCNPVGNS